MTKNAGTIEIQP